MKPLTKRTIFMWFTGIIIAITIILMIVFSGFYHETTNAKNVFLSIIIVLVFQYMVADPVRFIILAIDASFWPQNMTKPTKEDDHAENYNRLDYLKLRLKATKRQMLITERYRNEQLNLEYKNIIQDLSLYGIYFLILTGVVLVSRNELGYYNSACLRELFMFNHSIYIGLSEVYHLNQLFSFIESTLIDAFEGGDSSIGVSIWIHSEQNKMLGVVRLRQLRLSKEQYGFSKPIYTEEYYKPAWQLPYQRYHYDDKYWRVYDPWIPLEEKDLTAYVVLNFNHHGELHNYPELKGYVALLGRSRQNSRKILQFLTDYNWLTYNTSAVFMDFTLYNIDADMFSVCTLRVEQTPFGGIIPNMNCESVRLIGDNLQTPYTQLLILLIYLITFLQFIHTFCVQIWYDISKLHSIWYKLDLLIIVLNLVLTAMILLRGSTVFRMLKRLEGANKLEFLDFRIPARLYVLCNVLCGFLICATTLRLWKVMQFARVFQIFTRTLSLAWTPLITTFLAILIFLGAYGVAINTINGNHSSHFVYMLTSVISVMCFSFGFSNEIQPFDLFHGGVAVGVTLYATMGFVVSVLLMNVFSTLINSYFIEAKKHGDAKFKQQITFLQFLRVEFDDLISFICQKKMYNGDGRTVSENVKIILDKRDKKYARLKMKREKEEHFLQVEYRERIERTYSISLILNIQMEMLDIILFDDDITMHKLRRSGEKQEPDPQDSIV
ncbi:polycystin-2-like [Drosophila hydei]|uniref:Polycystin-2-like n=1 Tax=Drosophila hydei TaxID=7224 RepID=A0A6J1MIA7_DROHY|nr:polycystin-2-like [Drosophila hydei]